MVKAKKVRASKKKAKKLAVTPEVLPPQASSTSSAFTMDGTSQRRAVSAQFGGTGGITQRLAMSVLLYFRTKLRFVSVAEGAMESKGKRRRMATPILCDKRARP